MKFKMNMVGADGRLNYYRMSAAAVIAALHSHKMGLTNAEAERRLRQQSPNMLDLSGGRSAAHPILTQARRPGLVLALVSTAVSLYAAMDVLAGFFVVIACLQLAIGFLLRPRRGLPLSYIGHLLPVHAWVLRNNQLKKVPAGELVAGDIIKLQAGDCIAADVRLLNETDFVTNDHELIGGNPHAHKFVHALGSEVSLSMRGNLAYMGTWVVRGEAYGIATGTGRDTELGRILALANRTQPPVPIVLRLQLGLEMTALWAAGACLILLFASSVFFGADLHSTLPAALSLLAAAAAVGPLLVTISLSSVMVRRMTKLGCKVRDFYALVALSSIDTLLFNPEIWSSNELRAARLMIGRSTYSFRSNGYEPGGKLLLENGKPASKKDTQTLRLLFEAGVLAHRTPAAPPDKQQLHRYAQGDRLEATLVAAAHVAGVDSETLRQRYPVAWSKGYDAHRRLASAVHEYGGDAVLFTYGLPEAILTASTKLWDHGHVRTLSDQDKARIRHSLPLAAANGAISIALAYRILPKRTKLLDLSTAEAEQKLTLLGVVEIEQAAQAAARGMLSASQHSDVKVSLVSSIDHAYAIDSIRLAGLDDEQLLERLQKGTATFSHLTAEDKLRLVGTAQRAGCSIVVTGTNLSDLPAMLQANASLVGPSDIATPMATAANITADAPETLIAAHARLKHANTFLCHAFWANITASVAATALVVTGVIAALFYRVPLPASPLLVLLIVVVLQPVVTGMLIGGTLSTHLPDRKPLSQSIFSGLLAAVVAYASFLYFFASQDISLPYLDPSSSLAAHAATIAYAALACCLWAQIVLTLIQYKARDGAQHLLAIGVAATFLIAAVYVPSLQNVFNTHSLNSIDWLAVLSATLIFACLSLLHRREQRNTRARIVALHHTMH